MEASASGTSLLSLATWLIWGTIALFALLYFSTGYLFEVLAQKHDEPRWMAWLPVTSGLLMFRVVGWERWFWAILGGYALGFAAMLLPGPLRFVGLLALVPAAIAVVVLGLAYFPYLARARGLPMSVGLWVVVPQFVPGLFEAVRPGLGVWVGLPALVVASWATLRIFFHDGKPPHGPHPIGYVLTLLGVAVMAAAAFTLPAKLAQQEGFSQAWQLLEARLGPAPAAALRDEARELTQAVATHELTRAAAKRRTAGSSAKEPDPVAIAATCPPQTREAGTLAQGGREWWCETRDGDGWVRQGPSRSWFDNGRVEMEGEYDHGRRTGTWTRYWRTGRRRAQAEFRHGVQDGWMHRWDRYGHFLGGVRYDNGQPAPVS